MSTAAYFAAHFGKAAGWFARAATGRSRRVLRWLLPVLHRLNLPSRLAPILVALLFCTLVFGSYGIVNSAANDILSSQSDREARDLAKYLTVNVPDLRFIAAGHLPTQRSASMFDRAREAGNVYLIEVLDPNGRVRYRTHTKNGVEQVAGEDGEFEHNQFLKQARKGGFLMESRRGHGAFEPPYVTQVVLPIVEGGADIAFLDIYIDMTASYQSLFRVLANATASFALVLAVAFGLPAIGFWQRTRQKERVENQLRFLVQHDALTELSNRSALMRQLEAALSNGPRGTQRLSVLCMDLDHFKEVNDSLGHDAGDMLLKDVAARLRHVLRPGEHLARVGGDEFMILQDSIVNRDCGGDLARRLLEVFVKPFAIGNRSLRIGPSIGIAVAPDDGTEAETLVKNADMAMHSVKAGGRGTFRYFEGAMDQLLQRRRHVAEEVRTACDNGGFQLNFQPVYSLGTGLLAGFEALVRLRAANGEMVPPAEFVPVAEELGLVTKIGSFVLETACKHAVSWPSDLTVAVNISPAEFREGNVVERVASALQKSGLEPDRLEIEVTEGVLLADTETTRRTIDGLKKLGVAIVLDDFGTGYSSLSYLWQFRFDKIKIDQSFVRAIGKNGNVTDIIRTIVALGRALDLRVTAEGVETEAQAAVLRSMRCDLVQGYLYGAPVAQPDIPAFVNRPLPKSLADTACRDASLKMAAG